jgi:hypothetical protein
MDNVDIFYDRLEYFTSIWYGCYIRPIAGNLFDERKMAEFQ